MAPSARKTAVSRPRKMALPPWRCRNPSTVDHLPSPTHRPSRDRRSGGPYFRPNSKPTVSPAIAQMIATGIMTHRVSTPRWQNTPATRRAGLTRQHHSDEDRRLSERQASGDDVEPGAHRITDAGDGLLQHPAIVTRLGRRRQPVLLSAAVRRVLGVARLADSPIATAPAKERLTAEEARRIALAAQGFAQPRPTGRIGTRQVRRVIEQVGLLQLDSVNVFSRSHYLPLFARLGPLSPEVLDQLAAHTAGPIRRELFEYWGHEASLIPIRLQPHHAVADGPCRYRRLGPHGPHRSGLPRSGRAGVRA